MSIGQLRKGLPFLIVSTMAEVYEKWGLSQEELEAAFLVFIEDFKNDESR